MQKILASFFWGFSRNREHEFETRLPPSSLAASRRGFAFCVADPIGSAQESTRIGSVQSLVAIVVIRVWFFRTRRYQRCYYFVPQPRDFWSACAASRRFRKEDLFTEGN
jgi:hypothetical protein